jgi:hypothetical protein
MGRSRNKQTEEETMKLWIMPLLMVLIAIPAMATPYTDMQETAQVFYTMDSQDVGGVVIDTSGNSLNGTANNTIWDANTGEPSKQGVYKEFNRSGAFVVMPQELNLSTTFTISMWFKANHTGNTEELMSYTDGNTTVFRLWFIDNLAGTGTFCFNTGGTTRCHSNQGGGKINNGVGAWNHVMASYRPGFTRVVANNQWNYQSSGGAATRPTNVDASILIGGFPTTTANNSPGMIKAVGIFPYEFTQTNTSTIYNGGQAYEPCVEDWICDGYDTATCLLNDTSTASCNSVYDNTSCGTSYTGDYTEFTNQTDVCDYCTPSWNCTGYDECIEPAAEVMCNSVNDTNGCYAITNLTADNYTGDYTEFTNQTCVYAPQGGGGGGAFPEPEEEVGNETGPPLLSVGGSPGPSFNVQEAINEITGLFSAEVTFTDIFRVARLYYPMLLITIVIVALGTAGVTGKLKKGKRRKKR